jgi:hypothetical protein
MQPSQVKRQSGSESVTVNFTGSCDVDATLASIKFYSPPAATSTTTYRAKVDDGSFNAYSYSGNTWIM